MPKISAAPPAFIDPCKPKLMPKPPSGERWWHEVKFDGYRVGIRIEAGKVAVLSSGGNDYTAKAGPAIAVAVVALPLKTGYLDGELVVEGSDGVTDFGALQGELAAKRSGRLRLYLFDLLFLDGADLKARPLAERKAMLERLLADLPEGSPLRLSQHFEEPDGAAVHVQACRLGVEGIVSKLRDSRYIPGDGGNKVWQKAICRQVSTYFICGYIPSAAGSIDSVYFGERDGLHILYRGHVSIAEKVASQMKPLLGKIAQDRNPFSDKDSKVLKSRGVRFVKPFHWVEVQYRGITEAGRLRHASFVGWKKGR